WVEFVLLSEDANSDGWAILLERKMGAVAAPYEPGNTCHSERYFAGQSAGRGSLIARTTRLGARFLHRALRQSCQEFGVPISVHQILKNRYGGNSEQTQLFGRNGGCLNGRNPESGLRSDRHAVRPDRRSTPSNRTATLGAAAREPLSGFPPGVDEEADSFLRARRFPGLCRHHGG